MSIEQIEELQEEMGWTDDTLLVLIKEALEGRGADWLYRALRKRADDEIRENLRNLKLAVESEDWDDVSTFAEGIKEDAEALAKMTQVPEVPKALEPLRKAIEAVVAAENDNSPAELEEMLTELGEGLMALLRKK